MQIKSLRIKSYRSWHVADTATKEAIGWSQATYYRWRKRYQQQDLAGLMRHSCGPHRTREQQWTKQHQQQVLHLRQRYPLSGQRKIWKVRCRDQGLPPNADVSSNTMPNAGTTA